MLLFEFIVCFLAPTILKLQNKEKKRVKLDTIKRNHVTHSN